MSRLYKNRCGQGKAAPNGFLTNLLEETLDSGVSAYARIDKSVLIQNAASWYENRRVVSIFFLNICLTAECLQSAARAMNKLWTTRRN
ncbi:MAG: hypothetical protein H0T56_00955 [Pseudaminobacter sp.]|nr:hypothetical protein [Pseudaminobacter sp.]